MAEVHLAARDAHEKFHKEFMEIISGFCKGDKDLVDEFAKRIRMQMLEELIDLIKSKKAEGISLKVLEDWKKDIEKLSPNTKKEE